MAKLSASRRTFLRGVQWPCCRVLWTWPQYWGRRSPIRHESVLVPKQTLEVLGVLALLAEAVVERVGPAVSWLWPVEPEAPEGPVVPGQCFLAAVVLVANDERIELK